MLAHTTAGDSRVSEFVSNAWIWHRVMTADEYYIQKYNMICDHTTYIIYSSLPVSVRHISLPRGKTSDRSIRFNRKTDANSSRVLI